MKDSWQPLKTAFKLINENRVVYSYDSLCSQKVDCFAAIAPRNDKNDKFLNTPSYCKAVKYSCYSCCYFYYQKQKQ